MVLTTGSGCLRLVIFRATFLVVVNLLVMRGIMTVLDRSGSGFQCELELYK